MTTRQIIPPPRQSLPAMGPLPSWRCPVGADVLLTSQGSHAGAGERAEVETVRPGGRS